MEEESLTGRGCFRRQATGNPQRVLVLLQGCCATGAFCDSCRSRIPGRRLSWPLPGEAAGIIGLPGLPSPFTRMPAHRLCLNKSSRCMPSAAQQGSSLRGRCFLGRCALIQGCQCRSVGLSGCLVLLCGPRLLAVCSTHCSYVV